MDGAVRGELSENAPDRRDCERLYSRQESAGRIEWKTGLDGKVPGWQAEWMRGGVGALDLQVALLTRKNRIKTDGDRARFGRADASKEKTTGSGR